MTLIDDLNTDHLTNGMLTHDGRIELGAGFGKLGTDHIMDGSVPSTITKTYTGEFGAGSMAKELIFDPTTQSWAQAMRKIKQLETQVTERDKCLEQIMMSILIALAPPALFDQEIRNEIIRLRKLLTKFQKATRYINDGYHK